MEINREIKNITSAFVLEDNLTECVPYGSGHINDTYRLTYGTGKHYILQKMNRSIFTKPVELMENVSGVNIAEDQMTVLSLLIDRQKHFQHQCSLIDLSRHDFFLQTVKRFEAAAESQLLHLPHT